MIIQVKNIQLEYLDGGFVALKKYTKSKMIHMTADEVAFKYKNLTICLWNDNDHLLHLNIET